MKKYSILLIKCALLFSSLAVAQSKLPAGDKHQLQAAIANKSFIFVADYLQKPNGQQIDLTTHTYSALKISKDTVVANLYYPLYTYSDPMPANYSFLSFTSHYTNYSLKLKKSGAARVVLQPTNAPNHNIKEIELDIASNGAANLYITFTNQSPVSYRGSVLDLEIGSYIYTKTPLSRPIYRGDQNNPNGN